MGAAAEAVEEDEEGFCVGGAEGGEGGGGVVGCSWGEYGVVAFVVVICSFFFFLLFFLLFVVSFNQKIYSKCACKSGIASGEDLPAVVDWDVVAAEGGVDGLEVAVEEEGV